MSEDVLATQDGENHVVLCYTIFLYIGFKNFAHSHILC